MAPPNTESDKPRNGGNFAPSQPDVTRRPDIVPTRPSKHPSHIIVDQNSESKWYGISGGQTTFGSDNQRGNYRQTDLYMRPPYGGAVTTIASLDIAGKTESAVEAGNVYFEVNHIDLKTAGKDAKKPRVDDAKKYVNDLADKVIATLSKPGNEDMKIELVGHASYTGHALQDKVHKADGTTTQIAHNQRLSEGRVDTVEKALLDAIAAKKPELLPRVKEVVSHSAVGDSQAKTNLAGKEDPNEDRNVSVRMVSKTVNENERSYRVVHGDKKSIEAMQAERGGYKEEHTFTMDLSLKSDVSAKLLRDLGPDKKALSARGAYVLESTDLKKPVDINVLVDKGDDFQFLVKGENQKVTYQVNERSGVVTVTADGKPVANLTYKTSDGQRVKQEEILVGTMNPTTGQVQHVGRDVEGERRQIEDMREKERQRVEKAEFIGKAMDTNHDNQISKEELAAYQAKVNRHVGLGGDGTELTAKQVNFIANRKEGKARDEYLKMVEEIGSRDANGDLVVTKEQMSAVKDRDAMFKDMLAKGDFKMPAGGSLAVSDIGKSDVQGPSQTSNLAAVNKDVTPGRI